MNEKKMQTVFHRSDFSESFWFFLSKWAGLAVLVFFVFVLAICVYVWFYYVHSYSWTQSRIDQYRKTKEMGTDLDRGDFNKAVSIFGARQQELEKELSDPADIFRLKL